MDVFKQREAILGDILRRRFDGKKAALANAIDVSPSTVSRWFSRRNHKNIGEDNARHIESKLGLSPGALVAPGRETSAQIIALQPPWPFSVARERFERLPPFMKGKIEGYIEATVQRFEAEANQGRGKQPG